MKNKKVIFLLNLILIIGTIFIYVIVLLLYGPNSKFRDWFISTSMGTRNHQYLAKWFYDEDTIQTCLNKNFIADFAFVSNLDEIKFVNYSKINDIAYENDYEKQVLERNENNNDYKILKITGEKYDGYLAVIYDPTRVDVAVTKYLGKSGQYLTKISEQNDAFVSITGGGFVDPVGNGTGGEPLGITIDDGKLIHETFYDKNGLKGGIVGLTKNHKLFLGDVTSRQAIDMGIENCVSFGPYLVINGISANVSGLAGGLSPRTAIGQRKDGIFLFLVLDGDRTIGRGASYQDLVEIMENYGAYNASCLDGGTSAGMTVKNKLINNPITQSGTHRTRPIATAFIFKADEEDNGEYDIIKNNL